MYYYIGDVIGNGYRYVYDDSDRSVQFISQKVVEKVGIEINGILPLGDNMNTSKMKLFGFKQFMNLLSYPLCQYRLNFDVFVRCILQVAPVGGGTCFACFVFGSVSTDTSFKLGAINLKDYAIRQEQDYILSMIIPEKLLWFALNLKTVKDFEGLMCSFGDIFGSDIEKIVSNIGVVDLQFGKWF